MRRLALAAAAAAVAALAIAPVAGAQEDGLPGSVILPPGPLAFTEGNGAPGGVYSVQLSGADLDYQVGGLLPSFSPNGKQVATVSLSGVIYVSNVTGKGGARKVATQAGIGLDYGPAAWSPNGKQLAYTSGGDVYVVNATGGKPKRIYSQSTWEDEATHPVFSKSGRSVYVIALNQGLSAEVPLYQVLSVPVSGSGKPTTIQAPIPVATPYWALTPFSLSLSPSGNTLAVTLAERGDGSLQSGPGPYTAFAVGLWPVSGGGSVTVLPGFSAAAWAPNGTQLCANDSAGNLDVIDTGGNVVATPVQASARPTACTWVPGH